MVTALFHRTRERIQDVNYWMTSFLRNIGTALEEDGLDIDTSTGNMDDWVQNFRLADAYRQHPGTVDKPITYT